MVGKATFQAAVTKGNARITSGLNVNNNTANPQQDGDLRAAALRGIANRMVHFANEMFPNSKLGPQNTNATYAIGLIFNEDLSEGVEALVSGAKSVNAQETEFYEKLVSLACVDTYEHFGVQIAAPAIRDRVTTESGMHSEMAVVGSVAKEVAKARLAVICFGKRVCAPCGGLMNSYKIPHLSVLADGDGVNSVRFACDPATAGWRHPYSGTTYSHANNAVDGYQHPGGFSLSLLYPSRPSKYND